MINMSSLINSGSPSFLSTKELNRPCNLKKMLYQIEYLNNNKKYIEKRREQSFDLIKYYLEKEGIWNYLPQNNIKIIKLRMDNLDCHGFIISTHGWDEVNNRRKFLGIDICLPLNIPGYLLQEVIVHETSHIIYQFYNKETIDNVDIVHNKEFYNICDRLLPNFKRIENNNNIYFEIIINYKKQNISKHINSTSPTL